MLSRLLGLETEYAIRYSPREPGAPRPSNELIFRAIADAVRRLVTTHPGERGGDPGRGQIFTQNGGALYYEVLPHALSGGLLEASTPECRGPSQLLLYQKAQEELLLRALPIAEEKMVAAGWDGELGLIKNCRDAEGHVYGAQENYEVELASGLRLWLYRIGLVLLFPLLPIEFLLFWTVALTIIFVVLSTIATATLLSAAFPAIRSRLEPLQSLSDDATPIGRRAGYLAMWVECLMYLPLVVPFTALLRATAFNRIRKTSTAFFISRPILTGTGCLLPDGTFALSEKGPAMRRMMRTFVEPDNRPVFDTGNLVKFLMSILHVRIAPLFALFSRRQRFQLGLSDSNAAQVAEYLKVGTSLLVLDMAEAGFLRGAPHPKQSIDALHAIVADPTLKTAVEMKDGSSMTALDVQRWYLARAVEFVASSPVASLEARELVRLWGEALDALEHDPSSMIGRLDWVTKRFLIEGSGPSLSDAAKKKIDLKYHELGMGYLAEMEITGVAPSLVGDDEIAHAVEHPPQETPARARGLLIRELAGSGARVTVSWDSIRIGGRIGGRVIRLDDYRSRS
jgi:Pup amidohydrolase